MSTVIGSILISFLKQFSRNTNVSHRDTNLSTVATVGLEDMFYEVLESEMFVEVCAAVFSPISECPVASAFTVALLSQQGDAS